MDTSLSRRLFAVPRVSAIERFYDIRFKSIHSRDMAMEPKKRSGTCMFNWSNRLRPKKKKHSWPANVNYALNAMAVHLAVYNTVSTGIAHTSPFMIRLHLATGAVQPVLDIIG